MRFKSFLTLFEEAMGDRVNYDFVLHITWLIGFIYRRHRPKAAPRLAIP